MKIVYNILLPIVHTAFAVVLCILGFSRFLRAMYWLTDILYALAVVLITGGHYLVLRWGHKKGLTGRYTFFALNAIDYLLFGIHLVLVILFLSTSILFSCSAEYFWSAIAAIAPIVAVDIAAIILRHRSSEYFLYISE